MLDYGAVFGVLAKRSRVDSSRNEFWVNALSQRASLQSCFAEFGALRLQLVIRLCAVFKKF